MIEECITSSGGKHKISDQFVLKDKEEIERKWTNIKNISRDILIEDYKKTEIMAGKEIHNKTVI